MVEVAGYWAAMLDLTNPGAVEWAKAVIKGEVLGGASGLILSCKPALNIQRPIETEGGKGLLVCFNSA